jgi:hypothetical protein
MVKAYSYKAELAITPAFSLLELPHTLLSLNKRDSIRGFGALPRLMLRPFADHIQSLCFLISNFKILSIINMPDRGGRQRVAVFFVTSDLGLIMSQ